mmetsp:Transcript_10119/g.31891  ORF Transcript_10119/g.31891 Transcript_10119/m.31891 type:complete len:216 (-) Transcript_10119:45-692(-)
MLRHMPRPRMRGPGRPRAGHCSSVSAPPPRTQGPGKPRAGRHSEVSAPPSRRRAAPDSRWAVTAGSGSPLGRRCSPCLSLTMLAIPSWTLPTCRLQRGTSPQLAKVRKRPAGSATDVVSPKPGGAGRSAAARTTSGNERRAPDLQQPCRTAPARGRGRWAGCRRAARAPCAPQPNGAASLGGQRQLALHRATRRTTQSSAPRPASAPRLLRAQSP